MDDVQAKDPTEMEEVEINVSIGQDVPDGLVARAYEFVPAFVRKMLHAARETDGTDLVGTHVYYASKFELAPDTDAYCVALMDRKTRATRMDISLNANAYNELMEQVQQSGACN